MQHNNLTGENFDKLMEAHVIEYSKIDALFINKCQNVPPHDIIMQLITLIEHSQKGH